ncbi:MAG: hypothetical protein PUH25_03115 [Spirochaetales bacterium]|nr:hypothetical protein [Spirochaetales bacterium]
MLDKIIVDADFCLKLGGSEKYRFLFEILPLIAHEIYMHSHAFGEVRYPASASKQLSDLISKGKVRIVDQSTLSPADRAVYDMSFRALERVMINPIKPNKNRGEACSLAYAKATGIPIFATDEAHLQPIIDLVLNTGIDDITCLRIRNVVEMIRDGKIDLSRKYAKALWRIAYNNKNVTNANDIFDREIWPLDN